MVMPGVRERLCDLAEMCLRLMNEAASERAWPHTKSERQRQMKLSSLLLPLVLIVCCASAARIRDGASIWDRDSHREQTIRYTPEAEKDRVSSMPGWGPLQSFNMFSG